ncbi:MAG TPA: hypothetical protein VK860_11025 [Ilumatobacteraceae bacterium]|nr:hypothetical protein [Ilumatobacteraceae bacterium]
MGLSRPLYQRAVALVAVVAVVAMTGCDDDSGLEGVPTADVDSPAYVGSVPAAGEGVPPFGTIAVADEVYSLGGFVDADGSFEACTIDPPDRPGFIEIEARVDENRVFTFNVVDDVATVALGAATDADVDYDVVGSSVRGEGALEEVDPVGTYVRNEDPVEVEVTFDITCA